MELYCSICKAPEQNLNVISITNCGHSYHSTCLKDYIQSNTKNHCAAEGCSIVLTNNQKLRAMIERQSMEREQPAQYCCPMCSNVFTNENLDNIAIVNCGHLYHFNCTIEYIKLEKYYEKRKNYKNSSNGIMPLCVVEDCKSYMIPVIKILATTATPQWLREYKIMEKYKNGETISFEETQDLMKEINDFKTCLSVDYKKAGPSCSKNDTSRTPDKEKKRGSQKLRDKLRKKEEEIAKLKKAMEEVELEGQNVVISTREVIDRSAMLEKQILELTRQNENLKNELAKANANLCHAEGQIIEMNLLRESDESLQPDETLQSEVTAAREATIRNETLQKAVDELTAKKDELTQENEEMKSALLTLKEEFANHDSTLTDFMIQESTTSLQYDTLVSNLYENINSLQISNNDLKCRNDYLMKTNEYQWVIIKNILSPEAITRSTREADI